MMVLSGFLLGRRQRQLCGAKCPEDTQGLVATAVTVARAVWTYALHRAVRLWPMLLACVALQVPPHALPRSVRSCMDVGSQAFTCLQRASLCISTTNFHGNAMLLPEPHMHG